MTVVPARKPRDAPGISDEAAPSGLSPLPRPGGNARVTPTSRLPTRQGGPIIRRGIPRPTARLRLTALYGALFLVSGAVLLAITYVFIDGLPLAPGLNVNPPDFSGNVPAAIAAERSAVLHALLLRSGIALAIMLVVSVWFGWLMAGRVLRPLRTITATTRQISEENLHERLALDGPDDEVKELGDTIDGLLGRLESAFEAQRAFVANVSHELRTPLTMMRTSIDVADRRSPSISTDAKELSTKVRKGLEQAERLVEGFLVLARAQQSTMTDLTAISLRQIVSQALAARAGTVQSRELVVHAHLSEALVNGNETLLVRMTANLVDNAVHYCAPGGSIEVRTEVDGRTARLVVENGGENLDQDRVQQLVEPFRRLRADRTGSNDGVGLGLSIVAAIAAAHGGTATLSAREEGGLRVTVELPCWRLSDEVRDPE